MSLESKITGGWSSAPWGNGGASPKSYARSNAIYQQGAAGNAFNETNRILSQFDGDITQSPIYKRLLTSGIDATTAAYNKVRGQRALQARMSGVGGAGSAIAEGDKIAINTSEANNLGQMPNDVAMELLPLQMEAAGMHQNEAAIRTGSANSSLGLWEKAQEAEDARKGGLFSKIAGIGTKIGGAIAAPFTGGMSLGGLR